MKWLGQDVEEGGEVLYCDFEQDAEDSLDAVEARTHDDDVIV